MATVVHANVYNPRESLFKQPKSSRAECQTITCSLDVCELRDEGSCAVHGGLFCGFCPYGQMRTETGPTGRAGGFYGWINEKREQHKGVPFLKAPPEKLAFIGDYVYLPYSHMSMCEYVPFLGHASLFSSGKCFVLRDDWTVNNVVNLILFRPLSLMGGEIVDYQRKSVPLFKQHLREIDPAMWSQVCAVNPEFDVAPNYIGRKAYVKTLASPIIIPPKDTRYPVAWRWDGVVLRTTSEHAYSKTWGGIECGDFTAEIVPDDKTTVVVASNEWVTTETRFAD